jgi:eukaryotic-like serine/threonine-protein kinase
MITPELWQRVKEVLGNALDLDPDQRAAYLETACDGETALRAEVERLLVAEQRGGEGFLDVSASSIEQPATAIASFDTRIGSRVGPYRIVERIGEGGMGAVYRAVRADDQYQKQVAIKLIHSGKDSTHIVSRFKNERQILASLDHPNIARLLDGGTTDYGVPYFVMELIEGQPIDEYCDRHGLTIRERLSVFLQVCAAVQFAHQRLIIHRDIKPGNILVGADEVPKLLDFGIAKLLDPSSDRENATITLLRALTPAYASPEQIQGGPVTTASDVYSLGVVLYELLTGHSPYRVASRTPHELAQAILEMEPERPSTAVTRTVTVGRGVDQTQTAPGITNAVRDECREKFRRSLRGELDSIALKALEKERSRRYASASEFGADIKRYLNDEAVLAVPPSLGYRARKFARRYRAALATVGAFALVLVVASVVSIRQSIRANREAAAAEREAAVAEAVNDFLQNDLLAQAGASAQSGPKAKPDPHLEVRTALDRAAERIEGKFRNQPEVEASIRDTVGWTYVDLGLYPDARKQLQRALELRRRVLGGDDTKTLKSITRLGRVAYLQGEYTDAEILESQALTAQRRVLGPENPDTLRSMNELAAVYYDEGKFAQAEALLSQTLEIGMRVFGPEHRDTLASMSNLAGVYDNEGKYAQAEALSVRTLEIKRRVLGPEHPDTLTSMNNLGIVYDDEGKYAQAGALLSQTLEIGMRVLGREHLLTLQSMNDLAGIYTHEGKYAQAEQLFTQSMEIGKRVLGLENAYTAVTVYNLGCLAARRGDKDRAIALLRQSVDHGLAPRGDLGMEKDTDLASLYGDPRFAALVAHAKQVAGAKQKAAMTPASK